VEVRVLGFSQMSPSELAHFAGLRIADARRALRREFDEPFLIVSGESRAWPRLATEIRRRGLRATRGSRFYHIMGKNDKGAAVRRLETWFRSSCGSRVRFAGLGDSPNDIPLLRAVDVPILVARPGGHYDDETYTAVPGVRRAGGVGPKGWNRAVRRLIEAEMK
jgi:mannosyl-3-phosphoglycerate phosphatase